MGFVFDNENLDLLKSKAFNVQSSVLNGRGHPKVVESAAFCLERIYLIPWKRQSLDLAELANLRWVQKWKVAQLAAHFRCGQTKIKRHLRELKEEIR